MRIRREYPVRRTCRTSIGNALFTRDAENYARSQESKRIMLIDSAKLVQLWTDNIPRLSDQAWQRLPLTPIYFLTPEG